MNKKIAIIDMPVAEKDEQAWIAGGDMIIDYHKWHEESYNYIDATLRVPVTEIVEVGMIFGSRGGFHRMEMVYGKEFDVLQLSKNHKEVVLQIYNLAKAHQIKTKKYVEKGGEK